MSLSPPECLRHILDEIDYLLNRISDIDYETFVRDETLKKEYKMVRKWRAGAESAIVVLFLGQGLGACGDKWQR